MADLDDIHQDLISLWKGPGLTTDRLLQSDALVDALGGGQPPDTLRQRFEAAVESLDGAEDREALRAALGLRPETQGKRSLLERRRIYGRLIGLSADRLLDWEDRAIIALALRLLARYYAGAPVDQRLAIPHGGLLLGDLSVRTTYRDRHFVEQMQYRLVLPLVDNAAGFQYNSTNVETEIEPLEGVRVESEHLNGGSIHTLYFTPGPLALEQPHTFGFVERLRRQPDNDAPTPADDRAGQSFETPTLRYRQEVVFDGDVPSVLWSYKNLSTLVRPGHPSMANVLDINAAQRAHATFTQLYGGLHSGLAWKWQ